MKGGRSGSFKQSQRGWATGKLKGVADPAKGRKVICAALLRGNTAITNDWLAERLRTGHPAATSQHVNRIWKTPEGIEKL